MPYSSTTLDPYLLLGVPRSASPQEIKQAYRRIALETHPDRNAGDAGAADRFRRATRAYALLRDPEKRPRFDRTGLWEEVGWSPDHLDAQLADAVDLFAREFGSVLDLPATDEWASTRAGSVAVPVDVTWAEVETGGTRRVPTPCRGCAGSGRREGSAQVRCTSCGGSGRLRSVEASFLGPRIRTEPCQGCRGSGRRPLLACPACDGSGRAPGGAPLDVVIPRGVADGAPLYGMASNGSRFVARLTEDARWARDGSDLYATGRIPYELAVLGGVAEVELPGRTYRVKVDAGTASGHRSRVHRQGLPTGEGRGRGDLVLTLQVAVPERVGTLERWLLSLRRARSAAGPPRSLAAGVVRLQAGAWDRARGRWSHWREHHRRSSLQRVEAAAASLRATARFVAESEARLGPMLEQAFPLITPEAGLARRRLDRDPRRSSGSAASTLLVDGVLATSMAAALWVAARFAAPTIAAAGDAYWFGFLGVPHPAFLALTPVLIGLAAGSSKAADAHASTRKLIALPLGIALAAVVMAAGAGCFAVARSLAPDGDSLMVAGLAGTLAVTLGAVPVLLFLLGASLVGGVHAAIHEALDRKDRKALRSYDRAAVDLGARLMAMEHGFRQLLARADDARHPLTSLLDGAADALGSDLDRRHRTGGARPALALIAGVGLTTIWALATALAVASMLALAPASPAWQGLAAAAVMLLLCTLGSLVPQPSLERQRLRTVASSLAAAVGVLAAVGLLAGGAAFPGLAAFPAPAFPGPGATPGTAWMGAAAAVAALVLSFRLRDIVPATLTALAIVVDAVVAAALWPAAVVGARSTRRARG
jgi:molecular chaperone DnaJ